MYNILDFIENRSIDMIDFFVAFLKAGYGASMNKIDYEYNILKKKRDKDYFDRERKRRLQKYISKLTKEGLIAKDFNNKLSISLKGKERLKKLRENRILDKRQYQNEKGDKIIIVSYDLPVIFNKERNRLRDTLKILGFNMVHKSVWVGKVKLPKEFFIALEKLNILDCVEVLEVTKSGSLKEI